MKAAKTRATLQTQPDIGALFPVPTPTPEISAAQARELIRGTAPKPRPKAKAASSPPASIVLHPVPEVETIMPSTSPAPKKTSRPRISKSDAPLPTLEIPVVVAKAEVETAPVEVAVAVVEKVVPKKATPEAKKSRRPRVPVNLAEQYGQSLSKRVENGVEVVTEEDSPKKRLNRAERQARRELMNPDDDLLARLHRVHNAIPTAKPVKRPPGWRFDCGRCGQTSYFRTSGALCNCGALAIKD